MVLWDFSDGSWDLPAISPLTKLEYICILYVTMNNKCQRALTRRQEQIASLVRDLTMENGIAPSIQDVARRLGKTRGGVEAPIRELKKKGVLRTLGARARGLFLTADS